MYFEASVTDPVNIEMDYFVHFKKGFLFICNFWQ